jgi:hypothetical protein
MITHVITAEASVSYGHNKYFELKYRNDHFSRLISPTATEMEIRW